MTIDEVKLIELPKFLDSRGNLSFAENYMQIPFEIKRTYWLYDVPGGENRGGHAFRQNQEFVIALSGAFDVTVDDGKQKKTFTLNRSYYGLYIPAGLWRTMENFSTNSLALEFGSMKYDRVADYVEDYNEFLKLKGEGSENLSFDSYHKEREMYNHMTADSALYEQLKSWAEENRNNPTEAENVLWNQLNGNNLGCHFRRQHIIGDYIVDFVSLEKKLVIEIDGEYHNEYEQQIGDAQRTSWLESRGFSVLRFRNEEIICDTNRVLSIIKLCTTPIAIGQGNSRSRYSVFDCSIVELDKHHSDRKGNITVVHNKVLTFGNDLSDGTLPFDVKRVYYLYDVPGGASRGSHAHRNLEQLIIAASGSFKVTLDDGKCKRTFFLNRPYQGLYIKPGIWRDLEDFSSGAVCMVLASEIYQKEDYIRDYDEFLEFRKK